MNVAQFLPNPALELVERSGRPHLLNTAEGTVIQLNDAVRAALSGSGGATAERLWRLRFLVPELDLPVVATGIARRSATPLGSAWHLASPGNGWVVIGCPFSSGARPEADPAAGTSLMRSGLSRRIAPQVPAAWSWNSRSQYLPSASPVLDYGDVLYDDATDTAAHVHQRLAFAVDQVCADGGIPLVLGGDHSIGHPVIESTIAHHPDLRVVHLDAHADRAPRGGNVTAHCGDFMTWLEDGHPDLPVLTIGVRGFDSGFTPGSGGTFVTAAEVRAGRGFDVLRRFVTGHPIHLTVDVDVLDPAYAPEVAYPVPGGLDVIELEALVSIVATEGSVVGADFTEVCPGAGRRNASASAMTMIIASLLDSASRTEKPLDNL